MKHTSKTEKRNVRHNRIRAKVAGTAARPRLCVFKSNTTLYAQLIDDSKASTIAHATSKTVSGKDGFEIAKNIGKAIADAAKKQGVSEAVFDRGGYRYTGRVAALADGAREAGLVM